MGHAYTQSIQENVAYSQLLAEAIRIGKKHAAKAKYFVPKMYEVLTKAGSNPKDAARRIYEDLAGVWQKDTIRRLLPAEAKDKVAREKQVLSRLHLVNRSGLILEADVGKLAILQEENAKLKKAVASLDGEKQLLQEKVLRLERALEQPRVPNKAKKGEMTIVLTPSLFLKTFTLMRSSTKPLVMKVVGAEIVDVDKMKI